MRKTDPNDNEFIQPDMSFQPEQQRKVDRIARIEIWLGDSDTPLWWGAIHYPSGDNPDLYVDSDYHITDTVFRRVEAALKDQAFSEGYTTAQIVVEGLLDKQVCLNSTRSRRALRIESDRRQNELALQHRDREQLLATCRSLLTTFESMPTPDSIKFFFEQWTKTCGHRVKYDAVVKDLLAEAKSALIRTLVARAKTEHWEIGTAFDSDAHAPFNAVLYIETPLGQVSFHVRPSDSQDLPRYQGEWSGARNTGEILRKLYAAY